MKNTLHEENAILSKLACSFPCYRLIPFNELATNVLKINNLKNEKKFPDLSGPSDQVIRAGLSGQNAQNGVLAQTLIIYCKQPTTNNFLLTPYALSLLYKFYFSNIQHFTIKYRSIT